MIHPEKPQLQMIWPVDAGRVSIDPIMAPEYRMRTYQPGDEEAFLSLMADGEFDHWDEEKLRFNMAKIIPEGWFFAIENQSNTITGTAMCLHNYTGVTPFVGDVGWLAVDPRHRGHGLGYSLTAKVTNRFLNAGYTKIQLYTEYWRMPAIRTYLKLGYLPVLYDQILYPLWNQVCKQIGWDFTPDKWPSEI